jgi:hypothetical protein
MFVIQEVPLGTVIPELVPCMCGLCVGLEDCVEDLESVMENEDE